MIRLSWVILILAISHANAEELQQSGTNAPGSSPIYTNTLCRQVAEGIVTDIVKLKSQFSELSAFSDGCLSPRLNLRYRYKVVSTNSTSAMEKTDRSWVMADGCRFDLEICPRGQGWAGQRVGPGIVFGQRESEMVGVTLLYVIECPNSELRTELERIVLRRASGLQVPNAQSGQP